MDLLRHREHRQVEVNLITLGYTLEIRRVEEPSLVPLYDSLEPFNRDVAQVNRRKTLPVLYLRER